MTSRLRRGRFMPPQPGAGLVLLQIAALAHRLPAAKQIWLCRQLCSRRVGFYDSGLYWQQLDHLRELCLLQDFWTTKGCAW